MTPDINRQNVMQVATAYRGQPWICTVYFVLHAGRFYWLSLPERRHSQELAEHPAAAIAIALKQDKPVIGIQAEGDVSKVSDLEEMEAVLTAYVKKYGQGDRFVERFKADENKHTLYCFIPRNIMLFDELNHAENSYQEIGVL